MPLTSKGASIKSALVKEYGEKKGEQVLYAGKNKGTFNGIDSSSVAALVNSPAMMDGCAISDAECENVATWLEASGVIDAEGKDAPYEPRYNREAVEKAIEASNRRGPKISGREAQMIHALLKGRQGRDDAAKMDAVCSRVDSLATRFDAYCARRDADMDDFSYDREGSQWRIYKNNEKFGPPVESEEAAQRVVRRLKAQAK